MTDRAGRLAAPLGVLAKRLLFCLGASGHQDVQAAGHGSLQEPRRLTGQSAE